MDANQRDAYIADMEELKDQREECRLLLVYLDKGGKTFKYGLVAKGTNGCCTLNKDMITNLKCDLQKEINRIDKELDKYSIVKGS